MIALAVVVIIAVVVPANDIAEIVPLRVRDRALGEC